MQPVSRSLNPSFHQERERVSQESMYHTIVYCSEKIEREEDVEENLLRRGISYVAFLDERRARSDFSALEALQNDWKAIWHMYACRGYLLQNTLTRMEIDLSCGRIPAVLSVKVTKRIHYLANKTLFYYEKILAESDEVSPEIRKDLCRRVKQLNTKVPKKTKEHSSVSLLVFAARNRLNMRLKKRECSETLPSHSTLK